MSKINICSQYYSPNSGYIRILLPAGINNLSEIRPMSIINDFVTQVLDM